LGRGRGRGRGRAYCLEELCRTHIQRQVSTQHTLRHLWHLTSEPGFLQFTCILRGGELPKNGKPFNQQPVGKARLDWRHAPSHATQTKWNPSSGLIMPDAHDCRTCILTVLQYLQLNSTSGVHRSKPVSDRILGIRHNLSQAIT
jgi:hypothetical protein